MSTSAHFDLEIFSWTDGAQSSRVPILLSEDPIRAVRQSHLVDTDTKSGPLEYLKETEIPQPLPSAPSLIPPSYDLYLIVRQTHTPATIDTKFEPEEAPLETKGFETSEPSNTMITSPHFIAPSDFTTPLSPDHPLAQTSPAPTQASYYHGTARMATPSSSLALPIRKRYQGTSELIKDIDDESSDLDIEREGSEDEGPGSEDKGHGLEDEGPGSEDEEEEAVPEGQHQAVSVVDTVMDEPLGLGYGALRHHELALREVLVPSTFEIGQSSRSMSKQEMVEETPTPRPQVRATWVDHVDGVVYTNIPVDVPPDRVPVQTPPLPEWSSGSLPVSPSSLAIPTSVASLVTTPAATIAVDALPPTLFEGYDRDLRELYTRSRDVKDEIFSQCYRLRSLEQEQDRATVTFEHHDAVRASGGERPCYHVGVRGES
nr:hypothetical protein [Tanacetum cinerariifolium]